MIAAPPDQDRHELARDDELRKTRAYVEGLVGVISEAGKLAEDRTSPLLLLTGLAIVLLVIGSKLVPGAALVLGDLGPIEFAAAVASGVAILVAGAAVRHSSNAVRQTVIRGITDSERAFFGAARHSRPGAPSPDDSSDRSRGQR